jgi:T5orf172 domain
MTVITDDELLSELGVEVRQKKQSTRTPREQKIIEGFEEIVRFKTVHGRLPEHGENRPLQERLCAVRLDRLRLIPEAKDLLAPMDASGILKEAVNSSAAVTLEDDQLLSELESGRPNNDISVLQHVSSRAERKSAEEIANRTHCAGFEQFRPLFDHAEADLKSGLRKTRPFLRDAAISKGNFFILGGQIAYVADVGDTFKAPNGEADARLRVIYSNGTESNLLLRSLQRALYKDETGRRLTDPDPGPLFSGTWEDGDIEAGTIYVLRSLSTDPFIVQHRDLIHKIGVTGGSVQARIANAENESTYLLSAVEVVAEYRLASIERSKLEALFHRLFASVQLDLKIQDRFGRPVQPREWFLVPLVVIDEAVDRIRDGSITRMVYDPRSARLIESAAS